MLTQKNCGNYSSVDKFLLNQDARGISPTNIKFPSLSICQNVRPVDIGIVEEVYVICD